MSQANISNRNTNNAIKTEIMNSQHFIVHAGYDMAIMKKVHSLSQGLLLMSENNTTSRRIMLVEDNEDINHLFWIVLQDADSRLNVDAFTDPYVALENFRPGLYDLLLIDVTMPKLDGFELYSRIRSLDESQSMFLNSRRNVLQGNQTGSVSRGRCKLLHWKAHCEPRFSETSKRSIRAEIMKQNII